MEQFGEQIAERDAAARRPLTRLDSRPPALEAFLCPVDEAARIIGQKWTLQIVHELMDRPSCRFCELQEALGGVNPSTLSSRLKMLEEEGLVHRVQVSAIPPHVEYSLTLMGAELRDVIAGITRWSNSWLCANPSGGCHSTQTASSVCIDE
jgi:DNA-binding HxlR family transcriptional regulator